MEKIITIVLPIYNGEKYIKYNFDLIKDQIKRNADFVDFLVCNNGSTDKTLTIIEGIRDQDPFFDIIDYRDNVPIGNSIYRSIANATGKYIYLWGDDDIPSPYLIDSLLYYIGKYPNSGLFHFNYLVGKEKELDSLGPIRANNVNFEKESCEYTDIEQYVSRFYLSMGFLSSLLFLRKTWEIGCNYDNSKHYGYQFLYPLFYGLNKHTSVYISFPLCLKRLPMDRQWINRAVYYRFVGLPNLLYDLEKNKIIPDAGSIWYNLANNNKAFFKIMPQACLDKSFYRLKIKEINLYQKSRLRQIFVWVFINITPKRLYKIIRKLAYQSK